MRPEKVYRIYGIIAGLVLALVALLVYAELNPLTNDRFSEEVIEASRSLAINSNRSGMITNVSFKLTDSSNLSLINITFMWQLNSTYGLTYAAANGSIMLNQSVLNESTQGTAYGANRTYWNHSIDTTTLPDGQYNLHLFVVNWTLNGAPSSAAPLFNESFMTNVTIDNTVPTANVTVPSHEPAIVVPNINAGEFDNITFNVTVSDRLTGVQRVIFQFSNGTKPFNQTAHTNDSGSVVIGGNWTSRWGISVNKSRFVDENSMTVTIFAQDFAGSTNRTQTFNLNVDRTLPTLSLTRHEDSTEDTLVITIDTSADATTCTSNRGTVTGSGAVQTIRATGLEGDLEYSFTVTCTDEVSNSKTLTKSFTTDAPSGGSGDGSAGAGGGAGGARAAAKAKATTPTVVTPEPGRVVVDLVVKQATPITIGSVSHTVTVQSVTAQKVTLEIASEPVMVTLDLGESKDVDTDRDGKSDLRVKYVSLSAGKPKLEFVSLAVSAPPAVREAPSAGERAVPEEAAGAAKEAGRSTVLWVVVAVVIIAAVGAYIALRKRE